MSPLPLCLHFFKGFQFCHFVDFAICPDSLLRLVEKPQNCVLKRRKNSLYGSATQYSDVFVAGNHETLVSRLQKNPRNSKPVSFLNVIANIVVAHIMLFLNLQSLASNISAVQVFINFISYLVPLSLEVTPWVGNSAVCSNEFYCISSPELRVSIHVTIRGGPVGYSRYS